jgi:uncharacterized protein
VSAFDDEFGLFSETVVDEPELRTPRTQPTPRKEPQPLDEGHPERRRGVAGKPDSGRPPRPRERRPRKPSVSSSDPWAGHRRAAELLGFLARKLVGKPDCVSIELFLDETAQPVIELIVDPEDLGKVIGRSGRVAQALRTVVRATAEGRVAVDILDSEEAAQSPEDG